MTMKEHHGPGKHLNTWEELYAYSGAFCFLISPKVKLMGNLIC